MKHIIYITLALFALVFSCAKEEQHQGKVTHIEDYNTYLQYQTNTFTYTAQDDFRFWETKLEKTPNQYPYLVKAAAAQSKLFAQTGDINHLAKAEQLLVKANEATRYNNSGYLRALSRNYISQHKFKQALALLKIAEKHGDRLKNTQFMLFDVHLELGNTTEAKRYLDVVENYKDFNFLLRLSKWNDHEGDLEKAILYLEKATEIAEATKQTGLMQWAYTNIADYYGHAGLIKASYNSYLKALEIDPNNAYAKKGIAWIVYSHEKNPDEALRILNTITQTYKAPDYHLLKAEIAEFKGDVNLKNKEIENYTLATTNALYGDMYNTYNALLYAETKDEDQTRLAVALAEKEVSNRPTAQSYDLLAWTHFNSGRVEKALKLVENHVLGHTSEPEVLYHVAEIYKANGKLKDANALKEELKQSAFELGPLMAKNIENI